MYERASIQRHLLQAAVAGAPPTDPVSNAVLPSVDLVPVWPMRSRAAEYREATMRACVARAAAPGCEDPVRYLRRAAELLLGAEAARAPQPARSGGHVSTGGGGGGAHAADCAPGGAAAADAPPESQSQPAAAAAARAPAVGDAPAAPAVPGMSRDFAHYLLAAPPQQQQQIPETLALKYFGNELLRAGRPDDASAVFYRLLLAAQDTAQQAELLQLCLDCWACSSGGDAGGGATAAADGSGGAPKAGAAAAGGGGVSPAVIGKLADFVQRQRCLSPRAIVQMLEATHHGADMALALCSALLERAAAAAAAAAAATADDAALGLPGGLGSALELLLEQQALGQGRVSRQVAALAQQVAALQRGPAAAPSGPEDDDEAACATGDGAQQAAAALAAPGKQARGSKQRRAWRGGKDAGVLAGRLLRLAAAGALTAASLARGDHPALRAARVGPLLLLLRTGL